MKMLVVVASRHGATRGIGERIGEALQAEGIDASVVAPKEAVDVGTFDAMSERLVRLMPMSKGILPPGDYRDWDAIDTWAREIAAEMRAPVGAA